MAIRLTDEQLRYLYDSRDLTRIKKLNEEERSRLRSLRDGSNAGRTLAFQRWQRLTGQTGVAEGGLRAETARRGEAASAGQDVGGQMPFPAKGLLPEQQGASASLSWSPYTPSPVEGGLGQQALALGGNVLKGAPNLVGGMVGKPVTELIGALARNLAVPLGGSEEKARKSTEQFVHTLGEFATMPADFAQKGGKWALSWLLSGDNAAVTAWRQKYGINRKEFEDLAAADPLGTGLMIAGGVAGLKRAAPKTDIPRTVPESAAATLAEREARIAAVEEIKEQPVDPARAAPLRPDVQELLTPASDIAQSRMADRRRVTAGPVPKETGLVEGTPKPLALTISGRPGQLAGLTIEGEVQPVRIITVMRGKGGKATGVKVAHAETGEVFNVKPDALTDAPTRSPFAIPQGPEGIAFDPATGLPAEAVKPPQVPPGFTVEGQVPPFGDPANLQRGTMGPPQMARGPQQPNTPPSPQLYGPKGGPAYGEGGVIMGSGLGGLQGFYEKVVRPILERARVEKWPVEDIHEAIRREGGDPTQFADAIALARGEKTDIAPAITDTRVNPSKLMRTPEEGIDPVTGQPTAPPPIPTTTPTYSNTAYALERLPDKIKAESLVNMLRKQEVPVPKAELDALGLEALVEQNRGKVLTKAQVREWIADRVVRVEERVLGDIPEPGFGTLQEQAAAKERYNRLYAQVARYENVGSPEWDQLTREFHEAENEMTRLVPGWGKASRNQNPPKFDRPDLRLPGGENYREVLVKVPEKPRQYSIQEVQREAARMAADNGEVLSDLDAGAQAVYIDQARDTLTQDTVNFRGGHFDPNTLAHMRLTDRPVRVGGREHNALFSEEFQSDWSQALRKGEAPEHPLVGEWKEVLFKRFLRKAAEEGKDAVAWTTGEQQKARYNLAKHLDELNVITLEGGDYGVMGNKNGKAVINWVLGKEELQGALGKTLADRIRAGETTFKGEQLSVGGEWADSLYDRQMVDIANKWGKRFGARVERGEVKTAKEAPEISPHYSSEEFGEGFTDTTEPIHVLPLTPEMRASILYEGQPTFGFLTREGYLQSVQELHAAWRSLGRTLGSGLGGLQPLYESLVARFEAAKAGGDPALIRTTQLKMLAVQAARAALTARTKSASTKMRAAREGAALFDQSAWAKELLAATKKEGIPTPNAAEVRSLWNDAEIRQARAGFGRVATEQVAGGKGMVSAFIRETGDTQLGLTTFWIIQRAKAQQGLLHRLTRVDTGKRLFKGVSAEAEKAMYFVLALNEGPNSPGAWIRQGTMKASEAKAYIDATGSRVTKEGLFIGPKRGGEVGLYKIPDPTLGRKLVEEFHAQHPEAVDTLKALWEIQDEALQTSQLGDLMAPRSFRRARSEFEINVLDETKALNELAVEAGVIDRSYGMSYVPDVAAVAKPKGIHGRLRNFLGEVKASTRRKKTGATARLIHEGQIDPQLKKGVQLSREGLAVQEVHNNALRRVLALALEPVDADVGIKPGSTRFDKRVFAQSKKFEDFLKRNEDLFEQIAADLEEGEAAPKGKTRYQIRQGLVNLLKPTFDDGFVSSDPVWQRRHDALYKSIEGIVTTINTSHLTSPATQLAQSIAGNTPLLAAKYIRDALRPFVAAVLGDGEISRMAAVQEALIDVYSDVRAPIAAFTRTSRRRIPSELVGETLASDVASTTNPLRTAQSLVLTPMRLADIAYKRVVWESVLHARAWREWNRIKDTKAAEGKTRDTFVKEWRENVPPEVEMLAYLEMDTFGAFDYGNVNRAVAAMRGQGAAGNVARWAGLAGKAVLPYPVWPYKIIANFYGEAARSAKILAQPHKHPRAAIVNAVATLGAYVLIHDFFKEIYERTRPDDLPAPVSDVLAEKTPNLPPNPMLEGHDVSEQDIPYYLRKSIRLPLGEYWVNVGQVPVLSDIAFAHELEKGGISAQDVIGNRLGLGILPSAYMVFSGIGNQFNQHMAPGARAGQFTASLTPLNVEMRFLRRKTDDFRRDTKIEGDSWTQAFWKGFQNEYPILSRRLKPIFRGDTKQFLMYKPEEVSLSFLLGNTILMDEEERRFARAAAAISTMQKVEREYTEEELRAAVEPLIDAEGETPYTPLLQAAKEAKIEYEVRALDLDLRLHWAMTKAFAESGDPNVVREAGKSVATTFLDKVDKPEIKKRLANRATNIIEDALKQYRIGTIPSGMWLMDFQGVPPEVQIQFKDEAKEKRDELKKARALQEETP